MNRTRFLLVDRAAWDDKRDDLPPLPEPDFIRQIQAGRLDRRGWRQDRRIITCTAPAAAGQANAALLRNGYNARFT